MNGIFTYYMNGLIFFGGKCRWILQFYSEHLVKRMSSTIMTLIYFFLLKQKTNVMVEQWRSVLTNLQADPKSISQFPRQVYAISGSKIQNYSLIWQKFPHRLHISIGTSRMTANYLHHATYHQDYINNSPHHMAYLNRSDKKNQRKTKRPWPY